MRLEAKNGVPDIIVMWHFRVVENDTVFKFAGVTQDAAIADHHIFPDVAPCANHAVFADPSWATNDSSRFESCAFINEYVFPDTDLPPLRVTTADAEAAGFEVRDVENLREHYALTLRHWGRRLAAQHEEALKYVNEATYRVWRLYMAGSAHAFDYGGLALYQTLLAKLPDSGQLGLPLTRQAWYEPHDGMLLA